MNTFSVNDVNDALHEGITTLLRDGVEEQSRNGPVITLADPVIFAYRQPRRRVLLSATRDANPFFHLFEALWMLSGSWDLEFPAYFAKKLLDYSDNNGITTWGGYGFRWRGFFGYDQLEAVIHELRQNPTSRRCVISMWNSMMNAQQYEPFPMWDDLYVAVRGGRDVPCNTHCYFRVIDGALNLTVCNRSNDFVWGLAGANAVLFSFLLEYVAMRTGLKIGTYFQFTNNCHVYTNVFSREKLEVIAHESDTLGRTPDLGPALEPGFDEDLHAFMPWALSVIRQGARPNALTMPTPSLRTAFMNTVALPTFQTWCYHKKKNTAQRDLFLNEIKAPDWQRACVEWCERRTKKESK